MQRSPSLLVSDPVRVDLIEWKLWYFWVWFFDAFIEKLGSEQSNKIISHVNPMQRWHWWLCVLYWKVSWLLFSSSLLHNNNNMMDPRFSSVQKAYFEKKSLPHLSSFRIGKNTQNLLFCFANHNLTWKTESQTSFQNALSFNVFVAFFFKNVNNWCEKRWTFVFALVNRHKVFETKWAWPEFLTVLKCFSKVVSSQIAAFEIFLKGLDI